MTLQEKMSQIKAVQERFYEQRRQQQDENEQLFYEAVKFLFDENPALRTFSWPGYTDYFNDGDECTFSVHYECQLDINDINADEANWEFRQAQKNGSDLARLAELAIVEELRVQILDVLGEFDTEFYKECFGDHVKVTVYRDKIVTEEYTSHD